MSVVIQRHRTAKARTELSRPLSVALADGVLRQGDSLFDYGCGRGGDLRILRQLGFDVNGWDPVHLPTETLRPADVVNLGYVINVIESLSERRETVSKAWSLANRLLIVSARPTWDSRNLSGRIHRDGILTSTNTFQKFYEQSELRDFLESIVRSPSIAAAPGIFYLFRSQAEGQEFLARRTRRGANEGERVSLLLYDLHREVLDALAAYVNEHGSLPLPGALSESTEASLIDEFGSIRSAFFLLKRALGRDRWPDVDLGRPSQSERRYEMNRELLSPLVTFVEERGRLPRSGEVDNESAVIASFKSIRGAFAIIRRATGAERWHVLEEAARENLLVYLALSAFGGRPKFSDLSEDLQFDIRDLFGSYKAATADADQLLFKAGDRQAIDSAAKASPIGKATPEAIYAHVSALSSLPPLLRVYEGCGRTLAGTVDEATIVKLHRQKAQVSYLSYPDFDRAPHPELATVVIARLERLSLSFRDFRDSFNPPILHRKELFVVPDYPGREKFEALTKQEERRNLLDAPHIGTVEGWQAHLAESGLALRGHRLIARK